MSRNRTFPSTDPLPEQILGYVSVKSKGDLSSFAEGAQPLPLTARSFHGRSADRDTAQRVLTKMGFTILADSNLGISIAGPSGAYEELTGGKLVTVEVLRRAEFGIDRLITHIDIVGNQPAPIGQGRIESSNTGLESLFLERPAITNRSLFPTPIPPAVSKYHMRVPDDVAVGLNAVPAHRAGYTGRDVKVAMVDTGQYAHPFFAAHAYKVEATRPIVPGTDPKEDPVGHGTAESANVFAIAPDAILQPIRATDNNGSMVGVTAAFLKAKRLAPQIMTNSWGLPEDYPPTALPDATRLAWSLEILDAVDQGIFVVFAAGNGTFALEAQIPRIVSAGGAFMHVGMEFRASDYSSGFPSPWYPGRNVPDIAGLVGMRPRAQYIMLPVPPNSFMDRTLSLPDFQTLDPEGDHTLAYDGWVLTSGTSAAAPQIAGAAAVILGAVPGLTPQQVLESLVQTARDVRTGRCHPIFNFPATIGPDLATGYGVVEVDAAVNYAINKFGSRSRNRRN
jgi:hypothetical protein